MTALEMQVDAAVRAYRERTGTAPRKLYLGWRQYGILLSIVRPEPDPPLVPYYRGMRVVMLGGENALSVSAV